MTLLAGRVIHLPPKEITMSKFGSLGAGDKPFRVFIKLDGKQIVDKDKRPFFIDVHSEDGVVGRRFDKEHRDAMLALAKDGKDLPSQLEINIAKCAALTAGWHLVDPETLEAIDEPCTVEAAKELYSLPLTTWIWLQPWSAANNHANFIKRSASSSSLTQSGTSETAAS
jgi:hypothetical protein